MPFVRLCSPFPTYLHSKPNEYFQNQFSISLIRSSDGISCFVKLIKGNNFTGGNTRQLSFLSIPYEEFTVEDKNHGSFNEPQRRMRQSDVIHDAFGI